MGSDSIDLKRKSMVKSMVKSMGSDSIDLNKRTKTGSLSIDSSLKPVEFIPFVNKIPGVKP